MNRSMPFVLGAILLGALNPQLVWAKNYASVEIHNGTPDTTVYYQVRWGTGEWQKEVALKPGETWGHWWTYNFPNENRSPTLILSFNSGINRNRTVMEYNLKKNSIVAKARGGMPYYFDKVKGASGEDYIDLFQGTKLRPALNLVQQGQDLLNNGDYDQAIAIRDTSEALAISPNLDRAYWWRSQAYAKKNENDTDGNGLLPAR